MAFNVFMFSHDDALAGAFRKAFPRPIPCPMTGADKGVTRRSMAGGMLGLFMALGVVAGIALAVAAIIRNPGWEGIVGGVFGGFFVGLLIMGAGAWVSLAMMRPPRIPDTEGGEEIEAQLRDVLAELEKSRIETLEQINRRAMWRIPLGASLGVAMWIASQYSDDPGDLWEFATLIVAGGIGGFVWASFCLSSRFARLYKNNVLPRLAGTFGKLSYRHAVAPNLSELRQESIFRRFDHVHADVEIFGTHRGLPLNIVELKLDSGSGKNKQTVFDGLLVTIDLPRDTHAITAVISDAGDFGNFAERMGKSGRQRVRLEDPVFEKVYEVYGTDQIAARALLHPAFMERLLALGGLAGFGRPFALCSGRMLQIAMPKRMGRQLFEPPSFRKPAASREALVQLRKDIEAVLAAADAVIDLDHRFETMARR
jgi:hypothetical protein